MKYVLLGILSCLLKYLGLISLKLSLNDLYLKSFDEIGTDSTFMLICII